MVLAIVVAFLIATVGSASANGACIGDATGEVFNCGDTVNESCTLNDTMTCSGTHGLIIGSDDIAIEGYNATDNAYYGITGDDTPSTYGIYNYNSPQGYGYNNVSINNLTISGFTHGIYIKGKMGENPPYPCLNNVENNLIYNCTVHDNGDGFGINLFKCVCNSIITECEVYNTRGTLGGSCDDPGAGIRLFGKSNHNDVTNNVVHHNDLAGIYSKKMCMHNFIFNNTVYENGQTTGVIYFGGGIRFQCKKSHFERIENNTVTDNFGPGIFIGGNDCEVRNNTVTDNKDANSTQPNGRGDGLRNDRYADSGGSRTEIYDNTFCDNEHLDINVENAAQSVTGDENCCDTTLNYDDAGTTGCTYCCGADLVITDIWIERGKGCTDGEEIEEKELEEFMQEKDMEKEQKELKQLIDELGISMEDIDSIDEKCIWGHKVYYEVANMGCQEWAGWSVSNLTVDGGFKMFDLVRPLAPKQSRVERFWFYRLPGGEHEVEVCADFLHWVSECNETNNCLTKTLGG